MDTPIVPLKQCFRCGEIKPHTSEFFPKSGKKYGNPLQGVCLACKNARGREYARAHSKENTERSTKWAKEHPERVRATGKKSKDKYRDEINAKARKSAHENRAKETARHKRYIEEHPEMAASIAKRYREKHPDRVRANNRIHRARKRNSPGKHSLADVQLQIKAQTDKRKRLRCWWCGKPIVGQYHIDHRIPLAKGGSDAPENICISCPDCNRHKHTKLPRDMGRLF